MELDKITRVISVTATGLAAIVLGVTGYVSANVPDRPAPVILQEDDPGWDCRTMGDRNCLPRVIVPPSPRMV